FPGQLPLELLIGGGMNVLQNDLIAFFHIRRAPVEEKVGEKKAHFFEISAAGALIFDPIRGAACRDDDDPLFVRKEENRLQRHCDRENDGKEEKAVFPADQVLHLLLFELTVHYLIQKRLCDGGRAMPRRRLKR